MKLCSLLQLHERRWIQKDGATCQTASTSTDMLKEHLWDRIIWKGLWPFGFPVDERFLDQLHNYQLLNPVSRNQYLQNMSRYVIPVFVCGIPDLVFSPS
jgi:hypothetical protein